MGRRCEALALVAFALLGVLGCREVRPEAGLPAAAFEGPTPRLVSSDRGFWFAVTDGTTKMTSWAIVGDEAPELLYAVPVGNRTARLLPATPFAYPKLDALRNQVTPLQWVDAPTAAGPEDRVGLYSGKGAVAWNGDAPADGTPVVLLSAAPNAAEPRLGDWLRGVAVVRGTGLGDLVVDDGDAGPFLVIPEAARPSETLRVATLVDEHIEAPGVQVAKSSATVPDGAHNRWTLQPLARKEGVDAIVSRGTGDELLSVTMASPVVVNGLPLALSEETFQVRATQLPAALRGLAAMRAGRYLSAAYFFDQAQVSGPSGDVSGQLRTAELIAAAGYVDWLRSLLLTTVVGLDADAAYYLARGHALAGDGERAREFARRAFDRFQNWTPSTSVLGLAQTGVLLGRLAAEDGDWETAALETLDAADRYAEQEDDMRAAEAERRAASYLVEAGNPAAAVKAGLLARSRFFHGNSPHGAGLAELALADVYRRVGELEEAGKMARFASLRFEELGDETMRNRARIAEGRVLAESVRGQGVRDLEAAFARAAKLGDEGGIVDAASSLVALGAVAPATVATYGLGILRNVEHVDDIHTRMRAAQALAMLCERGLADGLATANATPWETEKGLAACSRPAVPEADDRMLSALLVQGWAAVGDGKLDEASSIAARAIAAVDEETRRDAPKLGAEALFLDAAVLQAQKDPNASKRIEEGLALLAKSVDPTRLAGVYAELGRRFAVRGQIPLASELFDAAIRAAGEQGQTELRREIAMESVRLLHEAGDLDATREAIRIAEPILESAGATSAPLLARLWTYQHDVLLRLGRDADAKVASEKLDRALTESDGQARLDVLLLGGRLALERGDLAGARALLDRADVAVAELPTGLAGDANVQVMQARSLVLRGRVAAREGKTSGAHDEFRRAGATLAEAASSDEVLRTRIDAFAGAGHTAPSDSAVGEAIAALEEVRSQTRRETPALIPVVTAALAELEISAGRPGRALELIEQAAADGSSTAPGHDQAFCLEARAMALGGRKDGAKRLGECANRLAGAARTEVEFLAALLDPDADQAARRRGLREITASSSATLSPRDRERVTLASELQLGSQRPDAARRAKLETAVERAAAGTDAEAKVRAVAALAEHLIESGEAAAATTTIDANSSAFYDAGGSAPGLLARLRVQALVASLDPVAALNYAGRAVAETPDLSATDEAEIALSAANNAVLLGMWQHARSLLNDARARATDARNRRLTARIQTLAKRFDLPLED